MLLHGLLRAAASALLQRIPVSTRLILHLGQTMLGAVRWFAVEAHCQQYVAEEDLELSLIHI